MLAFSGGSVQGGAGVGAAESSLSAASGHRSTCCPQWRWLRRSIHLVLQMVYFQMCAEGRSKKFFVHIVLSRFRLCSDRYITAMLRPLFHLCSVYPFLSCLVGYVLAIFRLQFCLCSVHILSMFCLRFFLCSYYVLSMFQTCSIFSSSHIPLDMFCYVPSMYCCFVIL